MLAGDRAMQLVETIVPPGVIRLIRIRDAWARVAAGPLLRRTWPADVRGYELIVNVHDNQWLHELTYNKQFLLKGLKNLVPKARIESMRFRVGVVLPPPLPEDPPEVPAPDRSRKILAPDPPPATIEAMSTIEAHDSELANLIAIARYKLGRNT